MTNPPSNKSTMKRAKVKQQKSLLDDFGTSQKQARKETYVASLPQVSDLPDQLTSLVERSKQQRCINDAPLICIPPQNGEHAKIFQGTCNSWNCPRCGLIRAATEYARMIEGIKTLMKDHALYMLTFTPKGKVTCAAAEKSYLADTNRILSTLRAQVAKDGKAWHYCQVTERQRRGHPHSHLITTFAPRDAFYIKNDYKRYVLEVAKVNRKLPLEERFSPRKPDKIKDYEMFSGWLVLRCSKAGLGPQVSISRVQNPTATAIYLAKYLFKAAQETEWPKGWKRIRYSQSWPKMPEREDVGAFAVLKREDWDNVRSFPVVVTSEDYTFEYCKKQFCGNIWIDRDGNLYDKLE